MDGRRTCRLNAPQRNPQMRIAIRTLSTPSISILTSYNALSRLKLTWPERLEFKHLFQCCEQLLLTICKKRINPGSNEINAGLNCVHIFITVSSDIQFPVSHNINVPLYSTTRFIVKIISAWGSMTLHLCDANSSLNGYTRHYRITSPIR